jgi:hypothetical protein
MKTNTLLIIAALALASCGKKTEETAKAAETPAAPVPAAVSDTRIESEIANALAGTPPAPVPASVSDLQREAEDIIAKYPGKTATDLLNVPEVNTKLRNLLGKLAQDKALQQRINGSVDLAAQIKGLEGAAKLDLDMKGYSKIRTSRMLQAALSEDPNQLVAFLVGEIGEATPDLSFGGLERAPNGVSIVPNPAAAPAATPESTPKTDLPD